MHVIRHKLRNCGRCFTGCLYARVYTLFSTRWIIRIHRTHATVTQIQFFGYCNSGATVFQQPGTGNGTFQFAGVVKNLDPSGNMDPPPRKF